MRRSSRHFRCRHRQIFRFRLEARTKCKLFYSQRKSSNLDSKASRFLEQSPRDAQQAIQVSVRWIWRIPWLSPRLRSRRCLPRCPKQRHKWTADFQPKRKHAARPFLFFPSRARLRQRSEKWKCRQRSPGHAERQRWKRKSFFLGPKPSIPPGYRRQSDSSSNKGRIWLAYGLWDALLLANSA